MRLSLFLLLMLCYAFTNATNYYINPSSDSVIENGKKNSPWKSLSNVNGNMKLFKGGDTVFLKRGELYFDHLDITCSGKQGAPVVFTCYGTAVNRPAFLFRGSNGQGSDQTMIRLFSSKYVVIDGFEITDETIDKGNRSIIANIKIAVHIEESEFILIRNMNISLVGVGVNIQGNKNLIDKCKFQNLRMIKNTVGGDDDYGANPIVLAGADNTISNCFFKDCWANSFDYTYDGGAIEMFGASSDNNKIINNTAINCDGFMEIGSLNAGSSDNNLIAHNTIINCGELVYMSTNGKYKIAVNNLRISDNIIIHSVNQLTMPASMIGMQESSSTKGIINLQNNIFWLTSGINVARNAQFLNGQMIHQHNTYYMTAGILNFPPDKSESCINKSSPLFEKLTSIHSGISDLDIFPFIYLSQILKNFKN